MISDTSCTEHLIPEPTTPNRTRAAIGPDVFTSVWEGSDADLLEAMMAFYPASDPQTILDATYNAGRFWKGTSRRITSMDSSPVVPVDYACDNRTMEGVPEICDLIIKVRKGPMMSTKWQTMHHARKRHCFWIVCRNGQSCER